MMMDGGQPNSTEAGIDGEMNLWIDGREIGPWTEMWFRTNFNVMLSILWLNVYFHGSHGTAGVCYDGFVSAERVGCAGAASLPRPPHDSGWSRNACKDAPFGTTLQNCPPSARNRVRQGLVRVACDAIRNWPSLFG